MHFQRIQVTGSVKTDQLLAAACQPCWFPTEATRPAPLLADAHCAYACGRHCVHLLLLLLLLLL
jgi:hypothetical protein